MRLNADNRQSLSPSSTLGHENDDAARVPVAPAKFLCVLGYPCSCIAYNTKISWRQLLLRHTSVQYDVEVQMGRGRILPSRHFLRYSNTSRRNFKRRMDLHL